MGPNTQEIADLVTFTEEILNGKLPFLCSERIFVKNKACFEWQLRRKAFLTFLSFM